MLQGFKDTLTGQTIKTPKQNEVKFTFRSVGEHGLELFAIRLGPGRIIDLLVFSTLICFGYRQRFKPAAHKRLMLVGTIALFGPAFSRWPVLVVNNSLFTDLCCYALLALLAGYDVWSIGKIHRATLWGSTILDRTVVWHRLAIYMQRLGSLLH